MTTPNLRERVARAIEESLYGTERIGRTDTLQYGLEADAAIAIVLEEAAMRADMEAHSDLYPMDSREEAHKETAKRVAAAIRELKGKKNG
jgi:hypothetical protein